MDRMLKICRDSIERRDDEKGRWEQHLEKLYHQMSSLHEVDNEMQERIEKEIEEVREVLKNLEDTVERCDLVKVEKLFAAKRKVMNEKRRNKKFICYCGIDSILDYKGFTSSGFWELHNVVVEIDELAETMLKCSLIIPSVKTLEGLWESKSLLEECNTIPYVSYESESD